MSQRENKLKKVEEKIKHMVNAIINEDADLNTAKLVGFFIAKKGLNTDTQTFQAVLPKIVKCLFDFGELELCEKILLEAIEVFPEQEKLQGRLKKIQDLNRFQVVKKSIGKKEKDETSIEDELSSYDIASEITKIESKNISAISSYQPNISNIQDITQQQTMINTQYTTYQGDPNEQTLVPTPAPMDDELEQTNGLSNLPPNTIQQYPGLLSLSNRYQYIGMLGEGGMGGVFLAIDKQLERKVAIKFMNSACSSNPEVAERFIREARAQAVSSHPGIISIYDVGTEGNPFIVMEFVEGKTVKEVIKKEGGFSLKEANEVMLQIAEALEYAHYKKIIHRDVKPDNVIIDQFNKARLLDFGLAKLDHLPSMTIANQIMGTPYYMSPEQIKGEDVGPSTDIYAWGIMFYQLVTGVVPFTKGDILYHHVHSDPIPPEQLAMDIPHRLNELILKSIEKDINTRYATFREAIEDLKNIKV